MVETQKAQIPHTLDVVQICKRLKSDGYDLNEVCDLEIGRVVSKLRMEEVTEAIKSLGLPLVMSSDVKPNDLPKDKIRATFCPTYVILTFWNVELDIQEALTIEWEINPEWEERSNHEFYRVWFQSAVNHALFDYESNPLWHSRIKHRFGSKSGNGFLSVKEVIKHVSKVLRNKNVCFAY